MNFRWPHFLNGCLVAILNFSVSGRHGFGSVTQVCFGISVSNFMCMSFVAVGRSLVIVSYVAFKMAALWFWTMFNCNPPIAHCYPLLWGRGILVDHWSTISSLFRRISKKTSKPVSLAFVRGIHRPGPVNSPHKGPVTREMFPFDDVIMVSSSCLAPSHYLNPWSPISMSPHDATQPQCINTRFVITFNTLRPGQNGRRFADDVFKCIFLNGGLKFHWSLFLSFQLPIFQHWFR